MSKFTDDAKRQRPVLVFSAPNLATAKMVEAALQAAAIPCEVRGEQLGSLSGAIPVDQACATVWVHAQDEADAKNVVAAHASTSADEVRCPQCTNENPAHFSACWNCDASLMGAPVIDDTLPATAANVSVGLTLPPLSPPSRAWPMLSAALLASTCVFGLLWLQAKSELVRALGSKNAVAEWDAKNECLRTIEVSTGRLMSFDCDKDRNSIFELYRNYDVNGRLFLALFDKDENGIPEVRYESFPSGRVVLWFDHDQDGHEEERANFNRDGELTSLQKDDGESMVEIAATPAERKDPATVLNPLMWHLRSIVEGAGATGHRAP